MKLIWCPGCGDVFSLDFHFKMCKCSTVGGNYNSDGLNAIICGPAVPIGFNNFLFKNTRENQPEEGMGLTFEAFIIPKKCQTITYKD